MGEIAGRLSDYCIITSDNPRTEDPQTILDEIEPGTAQTGCKYEKILDRREAIFRAIKIAEPNDFVAVAGKGHEDYQIFADRTIHFDDAEVILDAFKEIVKMKAMNIRRSMHCRRRKYFTADSKEEVITSITTDSRKIEKGCLFIPLAGERFDGHDFINQAFEKGAVCCLSAQGY